MSEPPRVPAADGADGVEAESDRLHAQVGWVLRIGLALSVLLLASGMALRVASGVEDAPSVPLWHLGGGDAGLALSTLGVLVLALTPGAQGRGALSWSSGGASGTGVSSAWRSRSRRRWGPAFSWEKEGRLLIEDVGVAALKLTADPGFSSV